jgi:hypothetical protein
MTYGISGASVPASLLYARAINDAAVRLDFSPLLAYAVANRETIREQTAGVWNASAIVSGDGGHGLFQLTSYVPPNWQEPYVNAHWAIVRWLAPSLAHYATIHMYTGIPLMRCVADTFNAGEDAICLLCQEQKNPDLATTGGDYGADVIGCYQSLLAHGIPT